MRQTRLTTSIWLAPSHRNEVTQPQKESPMVKVHSSCTRIWRHISGHIYRQKFSARAQCTDRHRNRRSHCAFRWIASCRLASESSAYIPTNLLWLNKIIALFTWSRKLSTRDSVRSDNPTILAPQTNFVAYVGTCAEISASWFTSDDCFLAVK